MAQLVSDVISSIKEGVAVWHYISDIQALVELLNLMSKHGTYEGLILWIISAIISGIIAEVIESKLPTPLRAIIAALS